MKKTTIIIFLLASVFGFSQHSKKKVYKKTAKKTVVKKQQPPTENITTTVIQEPTEIQTPVTPVAEVQTEIKEVVEVPEKPQYEITAEKVLKQKGFINNRNSAAIRGVEGFVKGVYSGNGKIYVLLEIDNRSNINYDIESSVFVTSPIEKRGRLIDTEEKTFIPIYSNQPDTINKKTKQKLVYVFDKFTISEDKTLHFVLNESEGERTLTLEVKPKYILEANSTK